MGFSGWIDAAGDQEGDVLANKVMMTFFEMYAIYFTLIFFKMKVKSVASITKLLGVVERQFKTGQEEGALPSRHCKRHT